MAVGLASSVMAMIVLMVVSAIELHRKSVVLNTSVFIAENILNQMQGKELPDKNAEMEGYPGYSYSFTSKEVEYDPFTGSTTELESGEEEILKQYRQNQSTEISTGLLFQMRQYSVTVYYNEKYVYELESLRGLKIEQTQ